MRILLAAPLLLILVVFALSNRQVVPLGLWPTDILVYAPLSIAVLIAAGLFFIAGAFMTWGVSLAARRRAQRAERAVRQLQSQVDLLKARPVMTSAPGTPPGTAMALPPPGL